MIPKGEKGIWEIKEYFGLRSLYRNGKRYLDESYFTYLEKPDLTGKVLISGLGMGYLLEWLVQQDNIESVTCIEISQDLIDLVWEHLELNNKAKIICMDINDYIALGTLSYFDSVFIDIWDAKEAGAKKSMTDMKTLFLNTFAVDKIGFWQEQKFLTGEF